jgi:hypothetical protein
MQQSSIYYAITDQYICQGKTDHMWNIITWSPAYRSWMAFTWGCSDLIASADSTYNKMP